MLAALLLAVLAALTSSGRVARQTVSAYMVTVLTPQSVDIAKYSIEPWKSD